MAEVEQNILLDSVASQGVTDRVEEKIVYTPEQISWQGNLEHLRKLEAKYDGSTPMKDVILFEAAYRQTNSNTNG